MPHGIRYTLEMGFQGGQSGKRSGVVRLGARALITVVLWSHVSPATSQIPRPPQRRASAHEHLPLVSDAVRSNLERIQKYLADRQWDEAVDELQRVMESDDDRLIAAPGAEPALTSEAPGGPPPPSFRFTRYVTLGEYCQTRLASLARTAPEALAVYRARVDPAARRALDEALTSRDEAALREVTRRYFSSSLGDNALYHLGEWALERGAYGTSRAAWRSILEPARDDDSGQGMGFVYPDSELAPADVGARLVLVSILEGNRPRATWELAQLTRQFPEAEGRIAGQSGKFAALLEELLKQSADWPVPRGSVSSASRGDAEPDHGVTAGAAFDFLLRPRWEQALPRIEASGEIAVEWQPRVAEDVDGILAYHPILAAGLVCVATPTSTERIIALDAKTGARAWSYPPQAAATDEADHHRLERRFELTLPTLRNRQSGVPRFVLAVGESMVLAELREGALPRAARADPSGRVVGVDPRSQGRQLIDLERGAIGGETPWSFAGPPLIVKDRLLVALQGVHEGHHETMIACFDARSQRVRWKSPVICGVEFAGDLDEYSYTLLAASDELLHVNTNRGVIAAIDLDTGHPRWIMRYPPSGSRVEDSRSRRHYFRDLTPCLPYQELMVAAPADCERIFALDAISGHLVWTTPPELASDAVHLLGTSLDRLFVSGDSLYALDARTGKLVGQFPSPGEPEIRGYGRGLLVGDSILWPTRQAIWILDQRTMQPTRQPINLEHAGLTGGNLLLADDTLIIAASDRLVALRAPPATLDGEGSRRERRPSPP